MVACSSLLGIDCDKISINISMVKALKRQSTLLQFAKLHKSPQTIVMYKWRPNKCNKNQLARCILLHKSKSDPELPILITVNLTAEFSLHTHQ